MGQQNMVHGTRSCANVAVAGGVAALSEIWGELQRAAGATERLIELLRATDTVLDPAAPAQAHLVSGGAKLVRELVDAVNADLAPVEQVKRFALLPKELDHEDGELTATQKVKRSALTTAFEPLIDDMYSGADRLPGGDQSDVIVVEHAEA